MHKYQRSRSASALNGSRARRISRRTIIVFIVALSLGAIALAGGGSLLSNRVVPTTRAQSRLGQQRVQQAPVQSVDVSAEGLRQIEALEAEKESRTPAQRKIASQLLQAQREARGLQMAAGVRLEPSSINVDPTGMVLVDITATVSDTLLGNVKQLGGEIIFPSVEYKACECFHDYDRSEPGRQQLAGEHYGVFARDERLDFGWLNRNHR